MTPPVRLQLSRRKGFNLQALSQATNGLSAMKVTRPGRYGNPYRVEGVHRGHRQALDWAGRCSSPLWASWANSHMQDGRSPELEAELAEIAATAAVALYLAELRQFERSDANAFHRWLAPLRGKNLACACAPGAPCHAEVLIEMANRPVCEAVP